MNKKKQIAIVLGIALFFGAIALGVRWESQPLIPNDYAKLITLSDKDLQEVDIALMNLLCAKGLPGTKNLDINGSIATLDQWAELVKQNEQKYSSQYFKNSERYDNSLAKFKAVNLGLTIKEDLKCGYNQELVKSGAMEDIRSNRFFRNSKGLFLHGFMENRQGSCSSLPVLMVAVGRRCGYPLYLATSKGHLFCRWDDGKERFNIETSCPGIDIKPDAYYRQWPHPASDAEIKAEGYLKSLSAKEELGVFSVIRGSCLQENERFSEAKQAYSVAFQIFPESTFIESDLNFVNRRVRQ